MQRDIGLHGGKFPPFSGHRGEMEVRNEANTRSVLPVAIVGAALRFPGAADPASFHELTVAGRRTFRELAGAVPRQRLGDPPRLAAEIAAAALADVPPIIRAVAPDRIGAFVADTPEPGTFHAGHWVRERLNPASAAAGSRRMSPPGSKRAARSRQAVGDYADAALHCSLRAVVAACEGLTAGEFDLVVAGGVSTGIGHGLAAGDVRVYDADPTGTLPGEGCGAVVLMRADDALAAGLPVYAEIVGWHAADPAPGLPSLRQAYLRAGVDPADVQLVEGHGAATAAEDEAELSALLDLFGGRRSGARGRRALGAVSANIGDTRGAAGIAALLKTALAMTAGVIPPATGCVRPHPLLQADTAPLRLPTVPELWPETAVKLAAVNSLGTHPHPWAPRSGAVHVVLRRKPDSGHRAGRRRRPASASPAAALPDPAAGARPAAPLRPTGAHVAPPRAGTTVRSG
jgi:acyl transferase domain-containing protein